MVSLLHNNYSTTHSCLTMFLYLSVGVSRACVCLCVFGNLLQLRAVSFFSKEKASEVASWA